MGCGTGMPAYNSLMTTLANAQSSTEMPIVDEPSPPADQLMSLSFLEDLRGAVPSNLRAVRAIPGVKEIVCGRPSGAQQDSFEV